MPLTAGRRSGVGLVAGAALAAVALVLTTCSSGPRRVAAQSRADTTVPGMAPPAPHVHGDHHAGAAPGPDDDDPSAHALPGTASTSPRPKAATPKPGGTSIGSTSTSTPATSGECPGPKTCGRYRLVLYDGMPGRWPTGADGRVTIRYHVNPNGSGLPSEQVQGAVEAAFAAWERVVPTVDFVFEGITLRTPTFGDGYSDIGFANAGPGHAFAQVRDGVTREADMLMAVGAGGWSWEPCRQEDDSCTRSTSRNKTDTGHTTDLQSLVTHEGGHWLGLADMDEPADRYLTMNPSPPAGERFTSTPALGDVLGARELYPCSCPMPTIHSP